MSMDFYAKKSRDLPSFIYRNLLDNLAAATEREPIIDDFCHFITELQPKGDWHKMKWCLPYKLKDGLLPGEIEKINNVLAQKRKRRNEKFIEAYPYASDEFSTNFEFLNSVFGEQRFKLIDHTTPMFTIGSCFATNIARYLERKGFNISRFSQAEDLNSPFSNAKMLSICAASASARQAYVEHWLKILNPESADLKTLVAKEVARLDELTRQIKNSDFLIITCGNVLDFFLSGKNSAPEVGQAVAPKFLSVFSAEDEPATGVNMTAKLKAAGSEFRLGTYDEVASALDSLHSSIRAINPNAHIVITLSPVPIESAIGMVGQINGQAQKMGAVEIDCISKSLLRVALQNLLQTKNDKKLIYFPSFEIVRWVAPNADAAVFGKEDGVARHVSRDILNGVCQYFLYKFDKAEEVSQLTQLLPRRKKKKQPLMGKLAAVFGKIFHKQAA